MMRRINGSCFWNVAWMFGLSAPALAGPYSSGLGNTNPGAVDLGVPGFVSGAVNPALVGWATTSVSYLPAPGVDQGWNDPNAALGPVTGNNFDIVSLGDLDADQIATGVNPGQITLSFRGGIRNSGGADFAVFENSLGTGSSVFGELAYVEVSSDGQHFARFPSISLTPAAVGEYGNIDPTNVHNLAGKHVNSYGDSWGTPFDLSDLSNDPMVIAGQVNLNGVKLVRIIDIPGSGSFTDSLAHPIYDPWLTWGSGGFDLETIGVTHAWLGGDANLSGWVDGSDLGILAKNWLHSASDFTQGDFNSDGIVDIKDLRILAMNWQGRGSSPAPAISAVPEPGAVGVAVVLGALSFLRRKSRGKIMTRFITFGICTLFCGLAFGGTADFEDLGLAPNSFHSNTPFSSGGMGFNNIFPDFGSGYWEGFAYSSKTDTTTAGFGNQFSSIPGHGAGGSATYGVGFIGFSIQPVITLPAGTSPGSISVTNTTYAYLSMRDGDAFAKKFGGQSGNDPDYFLLTITGKDAGDSVVGQVDFYLADLRFPNNAQDYLISDWTNVDLSGLAGSRTLTFALTSTDNGQFGMNTPAYFAIDNLTFVPEPGAVWLLGLGILQLARRRVSVAK